MDIFSFDRLVERARDVRNAEIREQAVTMRYAFNADGEEFQKFSESLMPSEEREALERKKVAAGFNSLQRLFGG